MFSLEEWYEMQLHIVEGHCNMVKFIDGLAQNY